MTKAPASATQQQFLTVVSREEAIARFDAALGDLRPKVEPRALAGALGKVLMADVTAPSDVPPFDRSGVDGFAVRAADLADAGPNNPVILRLSGEEITCGHAPQIAIRQGMASLIATGGPIPRGADAVVMVEQSEAVDAEHIAIHRAALPGQFIGWSGSDMARGEIVLRRGSPITAREIGMLAAAGIAEVPVAAAPKVAVLSTGDELRAPGTPLAHGQIHDANGPMIAAAARENGADAAFLGAIPDDAAELEAQMRQALATHDMLILSGGTSKGAGDLTHQILGKLGAPGIVVHGVALKPGKPLCLAVCDGKPVVVLPGFPTSAMFTFHDIIAPVIRRMAGLPQRTEHQVQARIPVRIPSELGRTEFSMVSLVSGPQGLSAYPSGKGSGAITSFAQADGFVRIEALADHLAADSQADIRLFSPTLRLPDLVILGSHCVGLDIVATALEENAISLRSIALGSLGGLQALSRGECDLAPIHLLDPKSGVFNRPFLKPDQDLLSGWHRMQGIVYRRGDPRFDGQTPAQALQNALADPDCLLVGRNQGSGTRILLDQFLQGAKPAGYWNQPRSHNAVAAAVAQSRADWGLTIAPIAAANGLGFLPLAAEQYDFAYHKATAEKPQFQQFRLALQSPAVHEGLRAAGFTPATETL